MRILEMRQPAGLIFSNTLYSLLSLVFYTSGRNGAASQIVKIGFLWIHGFKHRQFRAWSRAELSLGICGTGYLARCRLLLQ